MSRISLEPDQNGSGVFTIASPNSNTSRTLNLPDAAGTLDTVQRAGNVLQVVNATHSTQATSSSSTFADTGLTATITPTSATSKILVLVNQAGCGKSTNDTFLNLRLLKDSTVISSFESGAGSTNTVSSNFVGSSSVCYLDSPATTSATTYKTQFSSQSNNSTVFTQVVSSMSTITLMEIAA